MWDCAKSWGKVKIYWRGDRNGTTVLASGSFCWFGSSGGGSISELSDSASSCQGVSEDWGGHRSIPTDSQRPKLRSRWPHRTPPKPEFLLQQPPRLRSAWPAGTHQLLLTGQKGPIGLLLQLDGFPHRWCPPAGSGVAATSGTDHLTATAPVSRLNNGGTEHGPFGLNIYTSRVRMQVIFDLIPLGCTDTKEQQTW